MPFEGLSFLVARALGCLLFYLLVLKKVYPDIGGGSLEIRHEKKNMSIFLCMTYEGN